MWLVLTGCLLKQAAPEGSAPETAAPTWIAAAPVQGMYERVLSAGTDAQTHRFTPRKSWSG